MNPVYCPSCKAQIDAGYVFCPHCGSATSSQTRREEDQRKKEFLAEEERRFAAQQQADRAQYEAVEREEYRKTVYARSTGQGICPNCKSQNVLVDTIVEGSSAGGKLGILSLGCFVTPLALIALPFMSGKRVREFQCQYCSNRWRL